MPPPLLSPSPSPSVYNRSLSVCIVLMSLDLWLYRLSVCIGPGLLLCLCIGPGLLQKKICAYKCHTKNFTQMSQMTQRRKCKLPQCVLV
ncbi:hypothetical protein RHGRI_035452 [Rhododendron griersonianum]|uniref:Uncharacterized protein n=1 Tax=Rhododendron griersonianum TaxID=479676 RepID=A0AAV6HJZ1_9ERIC|nr:hypothetical protein RHGRI_035452 [Rhododendron griersonianum]